MSIWGHRVSFKLIAIVVLLLSVGGLLTAVNRAPSREITLVARGMAFYLESDLTQPNPVITVKAGERVRVVLRNDDRGITHDIAVPAAGAKTDLINWNENAAMTFDVPDSPGAYDYFCEPHALMMRGRIVVE
jgi:plastocyanin